MTILISATTLTTNEIALYSQKIGRTLSDIRAFGATLELKEILVESLAKCSSLASFERIEARDDAHLLRVSKDRNIPYITISFCFFKNDWYAIESSFTVHQHQIKIEVQTWFFADGNGEKSEKFSIALNNKLKWEKMALPEHTIEHLAELLLIECVNQRAALAKSVGISLSDTQLVALQHMKRKK